MGMEESVLCFSSKILDEVGWFTGFNKDAGKYIDAILQPENLVYVPRKICESDPSFKQIIPYAVIYYHNEIFTYQRKGSEQRLTGLFSLGVGGHISKDDGDDGILAYHKGYTRELKEEVVLNPKYNDKIIGVLYDDSNDVGKVHFGVVHLIRSPDKKVSSVDGHLINERFESYKTIRANLDNFEPWSQLVFNYLDPENGEDNVK